MITIRTKTKKEILELIPDDCKEIRGGRAALMYIAKAFNIDLANVYKEFKIEPGIRVVHDVDINMPKERLKRHLMIGYLPLCSYYFKINDEEYSVLELEGNLD